MPIDYGRKVVEMCGITKQFGTFTANDQINLDLHQGEIQAILGENGAGKSTLMNILCGLLQPTSGEIFIDGQPTVISSPSKAIELGIGMVHQHFMLVQPFTVTENIILGMEPRTKVGAVDIAGARKKVAEISETYGLMVEPDARIADISVAMQQRVEILKVLYRNASTLILDEPTSSLTPQEIGELMQIIRNLTAEGKSVILITHKLKEIKEVADSCTIIRAGKVTGKVEVANTTEDELASLMVGRNVEFAVDKKELSPGEVVLEVEDLVVKDYRDVSVVNGLNLTVRRGEVVGIAGVDGNGQTELVEALTGLRKSQSGRVRVRGQDIFNKPSRKIFESGVSSIPEDRHKHGLVLDFTVCENMVLQTHAAPAFASHGFLKWGEIEAHADRLIEDFDVRPRGSARRAAGTLSGGNQQKVIIAREIYNDKDLLICANPTRGLDVGAIEYVHRYIVDARNKNKAILLISFEMDEIMSISDRIDVMFKGKIVHSAPGGGIDELTLGRMMAGGGGTDAQG